MPIRLGELGQAPVAFDVFVLQGILRDLGLQIRKSGVWDDPTRAAFNAAARIVGVSEFSASPLSRGEDPTGPSVVVLITPPSLIDDIRRLARRRRSPPRTLAALAGAVRTAIRDAAGFATEVEELRRRGFLTPEVLSAYRVWLSSTQSLQESLVQRITGIGLLRRSIQATGTTIRDVVEALRSVQRAAGLESPAIPAVVGIGIIVAAILAIGLGGFALATGEVSRITDQIAATARLALLIAAAKLGISPEVITRAAQQVSPRAPPLPVLGLALAAVGAVGLIVFIRSRAAKQERADRLPTEATA